LGLDIEDEDDDKYDSGATFSYLVFVLVLVLDCGVFEMGSRKLTTMPKIAVSAIV